MGIGVQRLMAFVGRRPWATLGLLAALGLLVAGGWPAAQHLGAWHHCAAAQAALDRRDFAAAREHAAACLQVWADRPDVHLLALRAARRAGRLDEAEEHLAACQQAPELKEQAALEWALLQAQRRGLGGFEDYLRARLEEDPPEAVAILEVLSGELMRTRRLTEAQDFLAEWLRRRPDDPEALVRRGWVAERLLDVAGAVRDFQAALAVAPDRDSVRVRVAELLEQTRQPREALEQFEAVRPRRPDDPAVLLGLARCRRQLGQPEDARRLLDELLRLRPDDAQGIAEMGQLALERGRASEAETWLRRAAACSPHDRQITYRLYQCLQQLGQDDEAARTAARLQEIDADLLRMRELVQEVMRRPRDAGLRCEAGMIFLKNGLTEEGLGWLAMALENDPQHRPTHEALAEYYERAGQPDRAAMHREALRKLGGGQEGPPAKTP